MEYNILQIKMKKIFDEDNDSTLTSNSCCDML